MVSLPGTIRGYLWAFLYGIFSLSFLSCRQEKENPLAAYCGEEKPPPSHPQPYNELRTKPTNTPPYTQVSYVWYCLDGYFVEESWVRTEKGCWVKGEEYRRPNPGCPS